MYYGLLIDTLTYVGTSLSGTSLSIKKTSLYSVFKERFFIKKTSLLYTPFFKQSWQECFIEIIKCEGLGRGKKSVHYVWKELFQQLIGTRICCKHPFLTILRISCLKNRDWNETKRKRIYIVDSRIIFRF